MAKQKYTEEYIRKCLLSDAPLDNYFIERGNADDDIDLVMWFSGDGYVFVNMGDNQEFEAACVSFLISAGAPIFKSQEEIDFHIKKWKVGTAIC